MRTVFESRRSLALHSPFSSETAETRSHNWLRIDDRRPASGPARLGHHPPDRPGYRGDHRRAERAGVPEVDLPLYNHLLFFGVVWVFTTLIPVLRGKI